MAKQLTAADAKQSLTTHVWNKGIEICAKYGPLSWTSLQQLLADRAHVRYPCEVCFAADSLLPGEFAHAEPKGDQPEDGFTMFVHPLFMTQLDQVPALVLYQLVTVNYGAFASSEEAETFGAGALGLTRDEYYNQLCEASDLVGGGGDGSPAAATGGCGSGCGCG